MKQILLSFIFILLGITIQAQITMSPDGILVEGTYDMSDLTEIVKSQGDMTNTSMGTLSLRWEVTVIDAPSKWKMQLCDKNLCFGFDQLTNVDSNIDQPVELEADSSSIMDIGIRHGGSPGCGTYEVNVYEVGVPGVVLGTNTYEFRINVNADCTVATANFDKSTAKVFPNPTTDYFTITDNPYVKSLEIFNIVGKQMSVTNFQNGDAINVAGFPNGLYLIRMLDDDGDVLKTTRLIKR
ncbi:MAG: T9SS type A sorting domain-containing protein [Saprospiraceae bacterium]